MNRRPLVVLIVLALGLIAWLLASGVFGTADVQLPPEATGGEVRGEALAADADVGIDAEGGVLVGRDGGEAAARGTRGSVLVTVTNPGGHPLAGVPVVLGPSADLLSHIKACRSAIADTQGRVAFVDVPYDGSMQVGLLVSSVGYETFKDAGVAHPAGMRLERLDARAQTQVRARVVERVRGPRVALDSPVGIRFECLAFDAATGRRLHTATYEPNVWFLDHTGAPCAEPLAAVAPVHHAELLLRRNLPKGYTEWHGWVRWRPISPMSPLARILDPLAPAAAVSLSFRGDGPRPQAVDTRPSVYLAGRRFSRAPGAPDAVGRISLPHIPFVAHAQVSVSWEFAEGWEAFGIGTFGTDPSELLHLPLELRRIEVEEDFMEDAEIEDHVETDNDLSYEESLPKAEDLGAARIRVLRPDGSPGAGAHVWFAGDQDIADRKGRVTFKHPRPAQANSLRVWGAGRLEGATVGTVTGRETRVTLRGRSGGRVRVTVKAEDGTPLRFPEIFFTTQAPHWVDEHDGIQRLDAYGDAGGRRTFHLLPPGPLTLRARYAGRVGTAKANVVEGKTVDLEITIPLTKK